MSRRNDFGLWEPSAQQRGARDAAARAFGVEPRSIIARDRHKHVVRARQAAAWVLRKRWPKLSWPQIGYILGGRDHSTVIYAARQADMWRARDADYRERTDCLLAGLPVRPLVPAEMMDSSQTPAEPRPRRLLLGEGPILTSGCEFGDGHDFARLPAREIEARRSAAIARRRQHELGHLAAEAARYGLAKRGRALSEMPL